MMLRALHIDCCPEGLTESAVYSVEVIQECYDAIDEGCTDPMFLRTAQSYTKSLVSEILDRVFSFLNNMFASVTKHFNAYIVNDVRVANKYKNLIFAKMEKLNSPITYEYYDYQDLYTYPKPIKKSMASAEGVLTQLKNIQSKGGDMEDFIDTKIVEFGRETMDRNLHPESLSSDVTKYCTKFMRGNKVGRQLTKSNIAEFYSDMNRSVDTRKQLSSIRKDINDYYNALHKEIGKMFQTSTGTRSTLNPNFKDAEDLTTKEVQDISKFELQRNRLFNAYIVIYRTAFTEKLNILNEKIRIDSEIIATLCKRASVFSNLSSGKSIVKEENLVVTL